jgi:hypothetical protein
MKFLKKQQFIFLAFKKKINGLIILDSAYNVKVLTWNWIGATPLGSPHTPWFAGTLHTHHK